MSAATQAEMERLRNSLEETQAWLDDAREAVIAYKIERDAAIEREQAMAAHVERLREALHQALVHWGAHYPDEDGAAYAECEKRCDESPTTSLARRDLIKQAEGAAMVAESAWSRRHLKPFGNTPQECAANLATLIANDLRLHAEAYK